MVLMIAVSFTAVFAGEAVIVVSYAGEIGITPPDSDEPVANTPGMILSENTVIITGEESHIDITFGRVKNNMIRIKDNSKVIIEPVNGNKVSLEKGQVTVLLKDVKKGETFLVNTPGAVCGTRGTGWNVKTDGDVTSVAVFEGRVFTRGINSDGSVMEAEYWVDEGYKRRIKKLEHPGEMIGLTQAEREEIRWN